MKCTANKATALGVTGDHDWVLVQEPLLPWEVAARAGKLLWACPCEAFKWTSYAEWAQRQGSKFGPPEKIGDTSLNDVDLESVDIANRTLVKGGRLYRFEDTAS